ncbi:MAG: FitA-like ribbon-helix-helix domain-containing protein [Pseudonocardiaceae bacterium]
MAELHVRNLPPEVHNWLRQRAAGRRRSCDRGTKLSGE